MRDKPDPKLGYWLRPLRKTTIPRELVVVDTETTGRVSWGEHTVTRHRLRLGVAKHIRWHKKRPPDVATCYFDAAMGFWEWLRSWCLPRHTIHVYAHYASYDFRVLNLAGRAGEGYLHLDHTPVPEGWERMDRRRRDQWRRIGLSFDDVPWFVDGRLAQARVCFRDTMNFWRMGLGELGQLYDLPKLAMPEQTAPDSEWYRYCERDVDICVRALTHLREWWRSGEYGPWPRTVGAAAKRAFKRHFLHVPIRIHQVAAADEIAREAYYGGRIEVFQLGTVRGPVYKLDQTASYPAVMRGTYPVRYRHVMESPPVEFVRHELDHRAIVARVVMECPRERPYPIREGHRLVYGYGTFATSLAGPELARAIDAGDVAAVERAVVYDQGEPFRAFVDHFWRLRQLAEESGDKAMAKWLKLMMNSFYGVWGQRGSRWRPGIGPCPLGPGECGTYRSAGLARAIVIRSMGEYWERSCHCGEGPESMVAIAAYVTSYQRLQMDRLRSIAGEENCIQQVTDCLFTDQTGYDRLSAAGEIQPGQLGKLRVDGTYDLVTTHGLNDWIQDGVRKCRGIPAGATEVAPGCYQMDRIQGFAAALRTGTADHVVTIQKTVKLSRAYPKGRHGEDGRWEPRRFDQYVPMKGTG